MTSKKIKKVGHWVFSINGLPVYVGKTLSKTLEDNNIKHPMPSYNTMKNKGVRAWSKHETIYLLKFVPS